MGKLQPFSNNKEINILFGGDVYSKIKPKIDEKIIDLFNQVDYSVINLEAPIFSNASQFEKRLKAGINLFQKEDIIKVFKQLGIRYLGGANNHIMDFGIEGIKSTIDILTKNNIFYSGFGTNLERIKSPLNLAGTNIQILCVGEEEFGASRDDSLGYYSMYSDEVIDQTKELKNLNKFVIIFAHGGGEETPLPSKYILDRYKQFIDTGADLIIGHHPHVPRGYEEYNNKLIFYSLGNFIHDSFNKSVGILLKIVIDDSAIKDFEIIPIIVKNHNVQVDNSQELNDYINLSNKVLQDNTLLERIYQEQAHYMYVSYYKSYFKDIFSFKRKVKNFLKYHLGRSQLSGDSESEFLLLNLIRNKSHRDFIETALELNTKDIKDLRNEQSLKIFQELMEYINKFITI